jgi:bifunctional non-homologous end joining protein LigD
VSGLVVDGRTVRLTSADKVLWPETGFTKGDMIEYYRRVAPALLPHLADRPVTLGRFPDGVEGPGFAQNECRGRPDWLATAPIPLRSGRVRRFCVVNDLPSLLWLANLGTIELHPYLRRVERLDEPTALVLDLDPAPPASLAECCRIALTARELLAESSLASFAKTSGAAGLHVFVPLRTRCSFAAAKAFARVLAERLETAAPGLALARMQRSSRAGKVFVDWLQNDPMRSTVAPYSLRATPSPNVSTPVTWEEVEACAARETPLAFGPDEVLERLEGLGELFAPVLDCTQQLPEASGEEPRAPRRRSARR